MSVLPRVAVVAADASLRERLCALLVANDFDPQVTEQPDATLVALDDKVAFGAFIVDFSAQRLLENGKVVALTRLEYRLLEELATARGGVVEHGTLLTRLWGPRHERRSHYLREYVARLRKKLGQDGTTLIVNVARVGYRLDLGAARASR